MRPFSSVLTFLLLSACSGSWGPVDVDGDGYTLATGDCWENEVGPTGMASGDIHPGAAETWYDGFDQDCDGASDFDQDGDGHASIDFPDPTGVLPSDDCWDDPTVIPDGFEAGDPEDQPGAAAVYPGAVEVWYDGVDQDCGGEDDYDQDGDGYASATNPGPDGGDDCFDDAGDEFDNDGGLDPADVYPDAEDTWYDGTDANCAGDDDFDKDLDGWPRDEECDDEDPTRYPDPSIPETWYDGVDDNCDGNDGDQDGDGYYVADYAFEIPEGYLPEDCWDDPADADLWVPSNGFGVLEAADVNPGATETFYDALDQDCAGGDDFDQDGDGFANDTDCDDENAAISPGAIELCGNTVDEDCTGSDNDVDASGCSEFYADVDTDGYGAETGACLCEADSVYTTTTSGDCDDGDGAVNPAATETCETDADDDCDGTTNAVDAAGCVDWYEDADLDGYGGPDSQCACEADSTFPEATSDDCDDGDGDVNPGETEVCNDLDDDCDSAIDEDLTLYYADADDDGYGAEGSTGDCEEISGVVDNDEDCDDSLATVYPSAAEICDGQANDCTTSSSWAESDEDQMVSFVDTDGEWSDISSSFTASTTSNYLISSGSYYFCAGTYNIKLVGSSKTATIEGVYGASETTLNNNATAGSTVSVTNGSVTVSGLTIDGGAGSGSGTTYGGAVIGSVTGSTAPTTPHLIVEDCIISGGDATRGGGVASYSLGWVKLVRTTIEDNVATDGGGIYVASSADLTLEDVDIEDNVASGDGGGIYLDDGTLTMTGTSITSNDAGDDGGGIWIDTGTATCSSGSIYGNNASDHGGGVYLSNDSSSTASFTSTSCNFGTGATDNDPSDVTVKSGSSSYEDYTSYTAAASFVCSNATDLCTP